MTYYAYIGKNNDARILNHIMKTMPNDCEYFKEGDHFIMDRGFRDSIAQLEEKGIITHMPKLLSYTDEMTRTVKKRSKSNSAQNKEINLEL